MARLTKKQAEEKTRVLLSKRVDRDKSLHNALLLVHSDGCGIHWKFAGGVSEDQPFHMASIGKTFTSALVARLFEQGLIDFEDPILKFLPKDLLDGLFVTISRTKPRLKGRASMSSSKNPPGSGLRWTLSSGQKTN
jgi:CubicO group peptidase (beta-lactamase class C family)